MSERITHTPEHKSETNHEHHKRQHEAHKALEERGKKTHHEHAERIDEIRKEAELAASSSKEVTPHRTETPEVEQPMHVNRELKNMAYRRTLKRTQGKLSPSARTLSKVIHQPTVEAVSEIAGKTIARPSGILAGGITAFVGSTIFLWIARHYGYEYNFLLFALLFLGGFFIGLLVELGLFAASRRQR